MKHELAIYMKEADIQGILVTGAGQSNPPMVYLTGGGHMTSADLVFLQQGEPILYCNPMEREEAAKSGLKSVLLTEFPFSGYLKVCEGNIQKATAMRYRDLLMKAGVTKGKILLYGQVDLSKYYTVFRHLEQLMPDIELMGMEKGDLIQKAMMRKDQAELDRIGKVGEKSIEVVGRVVEYLSSCHTEEKVLLDENDRPLTIGTVKEKINRWLAETGLENPKGAIFAIGRDAGIPHSTGTSGDTLQLGKTIVFDFYPCEAGGGYFHDFTRTWSLGYATDEVYSIYEDVKSVYDAVVSSLKVNEVFKKYQDMTCDLFEAQGHATIRQDAAIVEGYIHSLGHGVGLNIHEMPFSGINAGDDEILAPGTVFTIEPGLYYPSKGLGVRLEDTYYTDRDGGFHRFAEFSQELVIKMKGSKG